jgi:hypothetical protein
LLLGYIYKKGPFPSFHFKPVFVFVGEVHSCRQQVEVIGSYFLIQFTNLCLLIGQLKSLIFRIITKRYVVTPTFFSFLFFFLAVLGLNSRLCTC